MEIRSDCPTNCKYICGDKCLALTCNKSTGVTIIPCDDFAKRGEELRKLGPLEVSSDTFLIEDIVVHTNCIVCGEDVAIPLGQRYGSHICDKCKSAILKMRKMLEEQDDTLLEEANKFEAENKRLKDENEKLYKVRNSLLRDNDNLLETNVGQILLYAQRIKQAKIEVLERVRNSVLAMPSNNGAVISQQGLNILIDELIEEVKE